MDGFIQGLNQVLLHKSRTRGPLDPYKNPGIGRDLKLCATVPEGSSIPYRCDAQYASA